MTFVKGLVSIISVIIGSIMLVGIPILYKYLQYCGPKWLKDGTHEAQFGLSCFILWIITLTDTIGFNAMIWLENLNK